MKFVHRFLRSPRSPRRVLLVAGFLSVGFTACRDGGADSRTAACRTLYDRLQTCSREIGDDTLVRELGAREVFVDECRKRWDKSAHMAGCGEAPTCDAFYRCAYGFNPDTLNRRRAEQRKAAGEPAAP